MQPDILIVGGGSAGCVLASRLTENPDRTVLLLEAGPDYASLAELPEEIARADFAPQTHDWGYVGEPDVRGNRVATPRGKIIGGSSSINYCFAMRGRPSDHDAWEALGNRGWSYEDLLPFYKAMESFPLGEEKWHGRDGLYKLSQYTWDDLTPAAEASIEAFQKLGYSRIEDLNAPGEPGFGLAPLSAVDGVRQSTALTYLNPARGRDNLTVRGDCLVDRVLFDGDRAVGVVLDQGEEIRARRVVLSSGAYNTPTILLRSGIGPAEELQALGIEVRQDLGGVGRNLIEHPVMWCIYSAKPPARDELQAMFQVFMGARSGPNEPDYDLHVLPTAVVPTASLPATFVPTAVDHPTGWDFVVFVSCVQPKSRGSVTLRSADPADKPVIDVGLYSDPEDAEKVAEAVRIARRLSRTPPLANLLVEERMPGPDVADEDLAEAVMASPSLYNHPCGTSKMGPSSDPEAVVDANCGVYGVPGLSVVDASVMPTIPRVPINPSVIVVAERAATIIADHWND